MIADSTARTCASERRRIALDSCRGDSCVGACTSCLPFLLVSSSPSQEQAVQDLVQRNAQMDEDTISLRIITEMRGADFVSN